MVGRTRVGRGFTLIELLVVLGIILLLVGILIPVIGKVQKSAQAANSQALIASISGALEQYRQQFNSYPGPLANNEIYVKANPALAAAPPPIYDKTNVALTDANRITMAENLV